MILLEYIVKLYVRRRLVCIYYRSQPLSGRSPRRMEYGCLVLPLETSMFLGAHLRIQQPIVSRVFVYSLFCVFVYLSYRFYVCIYIHNCYLIIIWL